MRIVFAGTPVFAVPALEALCASSHEVVAVYTQPDRPAGRGRQLQPSPVKAAALAHGLPVLQPLTLRTPEAAPELAVFRPDVMVVVAYGLLLPPEVLAVPAHGCLNIHGSQLPRWRGAAPIQRAVEAGDATTAVAIMRMEAGLDTGPVMLEAVTPIGERETAGQLHDRLAVLGAELVVQALDRVAAGTAQFVAQPAAGVTYARKLEKAEARLDWTRAAEVLDRQVRAFDPWPVAETLWRGAQLRVWSASPVPRPAGTAAAAPGTVVGVSPAGLEVACGEATCLRLERVQEAGRKPVSVREFLQARHPGDPGACLGWVLGTSPVVPATNGAQP
ncbi:MAG: hypothetical protein RJB26_2600 [Pseudomonadota bacterium]